jgi:hypothetical protein
MSQRIRRFTVVTSLIVLVLVGGTALAQTALAQLGLTEEGARFSILGEFEGGGVSEGGHSGEAALEAYDKLPRAARGQVTTGLYAWTKTYVNSAAFKKAYGDKRTESTPQPRLHPGTVDQELKAELDSRRAEFEKGAKDLIAAGMKEFVDSTRKLMDDPATASAARTEIEETRAKDKADYDSAMEDWRREFPADPMIVIARHLREFLATTADVDFAAKATKVTVVGGFWEYEFDNPAYGKKPWQWRWSYRCGPEALSAARTAAAAWVNELGAK